MGTRYRTKEEIEKWKKKDPIDRMTKLLLEKKAVTKRKLNEMNKEMMDEIERAVEFAIESPSPEAEVLYEDLYV